ncbi:SPOR domain-containing protein [Roseibium aggregatum]|uniref:SPOR domain-containing protein n=1 Tax=Roseibium aggregatum TaxID=187304 RepID=A0A939J3D2_9HYPH|nr:SPOR domain-containing protein [Roseibium aggregatum]MBN9670467.1 SPOR domain-containing protein [Roseibium aggregatum]
MSSGRVGATDYFAGLEDVAESESGPGPEPASTLRVEPSFTGEAKTGSSPATDSRHAIEPVRLEPYQAPQAEAYQTQDRGAGAERLAMAGFQQASAEAAPQDLEDRSNHVSSLWPKDPQEFQPVEERVTTEPEPVEADELEQAFAEAVEHRPGGFEAELDVALKDQRDPYLGGLNEISGDAGNASGQSSLAPSLSLDLEENLTAELEDELIGALRQSVDQQTDERFETPSQPERPQTPPSYAARFELPEPPSVELEPEVDVEVRSAQAPMVELSSERDRSVFEDEPVRTVQPVEPRTSMAAAFSVSPETRPDRYDVQPQRLEDRRPSIDENDFLAALNTPSEEPGSERSELDTAPGRKDDPAGIETLFADLDFPEPVERRPAASMRQPEEPQEPETSVDEIDDMVWPDAAEEVPQAAEDDTPPPPEGYDLDAVARAMQESDPSLTGAGVLPPHSSAERAAVPHARERSRRGVFVAAGVLGVGVLGAAGFFLIDGNSVQVPSGPPPVISGLQEPLKIHPEQSQAPANDQAAKLIYDRVDGAQDAGPDRLVLPESPQPAELPPAPADTNGGAELVPGAPKRVRTLVVRPDGTIISDGDSASPAAPGVAVAPAPAAADGATRVVTTTPVTSGNGSDAPVGSPEVPAASNPVADAPAAPAPGVPAVATPAVVSEGSETPAPAAPTPAEDTAAAQEVATPEPAAPVPTVLPRKKPDAPVQVATAPPAQAETPSTTRSEGPLNLNQSTPASPQTTSSGSGSTTGTIPSGTYIVQVTSQRTAAAASDAYSGLQRRYPGILGNREAVIVAADLGDRGIYYRARIPTGSRGEADTLCQSLQGAGGDCFVRRQP